MKTKLLFLSLLMLTTAVSRAQDIAVQSPSNTTKIYPDLNNAIYYAEAGSTIYLPTGVIPLNDTTKIGKKLTIIGVGHRLDTEGGNTTIGGNIQFYTGSDGSSLMGCYVTGNVTLANADGAVSNFLLMYCNVNSLQVGHDKCFGIFINQNYLRNTCNGGNSPIQFTNNVLHSIQNITGGKIANNLIRNYVFIFCNFCSTIFSNINSTLIINNITMEQFSIYLNIHSGSNCIVNNNMLTGGWGDNPVIITDWNEVFAKYDLGVNPMCDYHLKGPLGKNAGTDGTDIGIYGGSGFSDTALPPYPQIVSKNIPGQTDEYGNLKIDIKVKAQ